MTKLFDVCGLGSAIVDVIYTLDESTFSEIGYQKESYGIIDDAERARVLNICKSIPQKLLSGGSVANSIIALSQLKGRGSFVCITGDDNLGSHYKSEFKELNIGLGTTAIPSTKTSTAFVLVTPDAKRTMRWYPGVAPQLRESHIDEKEISNSNWLFIEGYLFLLGPDVHAAIHEAIRIAKKSGTRIALTISDSIVINQQRSAVEAVLPSVDLLFANEVEGPTLTGTSSPDEAFEILRNQYASVVVTAGPRGAFVSHQGANTLVAAFPCQPIDLTGAGDMFAGAFLYGLSNGFTAAQAARGANYLANKVITQVGPRLQSGTRAYWDQICTNHSQGVHA